MNDIGKRTVEVLFDQETIARRVSELADEITATYPDGDLLTIGLLKGSFIFLGDLVRNIERPLKVDFLWAASYGNETVSEDVQLLYDPDAEIGGRHVLLVEDVVESGKTLNRIVERLRARHPASLEICTLLHKRIAPKLVLEPRFIGFDCPRDFVVGYGLDLADNYRHLPFVGILK